MTARNRRVFCAAVAVAAILAGGGESFAAANRATLQVRQGVSALLRGQYAKAIESYSEALRARDISDVRRANIYNDRGVAQWRLKRSRQAIKDFNAAIELFPDYAVVYNNRGNALMDLERPDEALKNFDRAIELAPAYGAAHNNRGNALISMRQLDGALKAYAKAVELMPNNAVPLNGRGNVQTKLDRPFAAMRDFNRAVLLNAKYTNAYRNRADTQLLLNRHSRAIKDLTQAIASGGGDAAIFMARARAYAKLNRYRPAIKDFSKAIGLEPDSPEALIDRGLLYAKLRSFKKAQADLTKAITLAPNLTQAYVNRAKTYVAMGAAREGLVDANRALTIEPKSAVGHQTRAEIYEKLGRASEAAADYRKVADLDPALAGSGERALVRLTGADQMLQGKGEIIAAPFEDWLIKRTRKWRFIATNPRYPDLEAQLEMYGSGEPAILEWQMLKGVLWGIGLLRYYAGETVGGGRSEYVAIVDLWKNQVVAIEPHSLGGRAAKWTRQQDTVVVTDLQGMPSENRLRKVRDEYGLLLFADDWTYGKQPPPRRQVRRRSLFDWLFGD